ncbi:MAG: radical SAM protein [Acetatifactor sp.]|nr:radical SAM protein [Acetatifactor sp.]
MRIIDLKLTYQCNNDCRYCCQERGLRELESCLSKEDVVGILEEELESGIDKIVLTGGEPTMNAQLREIVKVIREKGIRTIQVQTNAQSLANKEYLDGLVKAGVNNFAVSLHGCTEEMHEAFTYTKGSFHQLIHALILIKQYRVPVALNCVITKHNINHLKEIIMFVDNNRFADSLQFAFIHITGKAKEGIRDFVTLSEAAEAVRRALDGIGHCDLQVTTEAIPFCQMYGREKIISELYNDAEIITYDFRERRDFTKARHNLFKYKPESCKQCIFDSICEGTWSEYPETYGSDEFIPIRQFRRNYHEWYQ